MTVGVFLRIDTGVIMIGDVHMTDHCLILTEIKWCQFRYRTVGK